MTNPLHAICAALAIGTALAAQEPVPATTTSPTLPRLADPVRIEAGGAPIETETGHAAPFVVDFDQDGKKDLVVGQFARGVARVYLNRGTHAEPRFDSAFFELQAGGAPAAVKPG
jgi:hypothetical protein